jgi:hypothetical protein
MTDTSVSGRAQRSAARLAAVAEGLYACELIETVERPQITITQQQQQSNETTFAHKKILLNLTAGIDDNDDAAETSNVTLAGRRMSILVVYEPLYDGGTGLDHGTLLFAPPGNGRPPKGRLLIVLGNPYSTTDLTQTLQILDENPLHMKLSSGLVTDEVASVQPTLYKTAGQLLELLEPQLRQYNTSAIHFVGHSLAGGVASLAATILDGSIPMPKPKKKKQASNKLKRRKRTEIEPSSSLSSSKDTHESSHNVANDSDKNTTVTDETDEGVLEPLNGLGRARSSALTIGGPPCLSSNVLAAFCTSFVYGDDIVCRTTKDSIDRLVSRMERDLYGGFVGKNFGWVSDTVSLTVTSLQSHAHGSEGEEIKLSIPGRAYLVRPRRLGNICSIHEVGNLKKGGREALREALLWQMHDVLLSKSMWKHHKLESYIHGLDRVQLRGFADDSDSQDLE